MQFLHPVEYDSAVYYCSDNTAHFNVVWKNLRYSVEETRQKEDLLYKSICRKLKIKSQTNQ